MGCCHSEDHVSTPPPLLPEDDDDSDEVALHTESPDKKKEESASSMTAPKKKEATAISTSVGSTAAPKKKEVVADTTTKIPPINLKSLGVSSSSEKSTRSKTKTPTCSAKKRQPSTSSGVRAVPISSSVLSGLKSKLTFRPTLCAKNFESAIIFTLTIIKQLPLFCVTAVRSLLEKFVIFCVCTRDYTTPVVAGTISKVGCGLWQLGRSVVQVPTNLLARFSHYNRQQQLQKLHRDAVEARDRICLEESDARSQISSCRQKSDNFVSYPTGSAENIPESTIKETCVKLTTETERIGTFMSRRSSVVASAENVTSHMWFLMIVTVKKSDVDCTQHLDSLSYCCKRHVEREKKIVYELILPPKTVLKFNLGRTETKRVSDIIRFKRVRNRAQTERGEIVMEAEAAF